MLNVLVIAIIAICALWVYWDATGSKIGKVPGAGGMFNISAGAWSVVTLLLWIIGFPAYLIKRRALIERAKSQPVEVRGRIFKMVVLAAIGGLWTLLTLAGAIQDTPAPKPPASAAAQPKPAAPVVVAKAAPQPAVTPTARETAQPASATVSVQAPVRAVASARENLPVQGKLAAAPQEKPAPVVPEKPAPAREKLASLVEPPKPAAAPRKAPEPAAAPMQTAGVPTAVGTMRFNDLVTAVLYRDAGAVNDLLAFGKWPDRADSRGMTPLMLAAMLGDAPIAEALLKAGASPNRAGPGGDTAMSIARERKDAAMVGLLQRHGAR